MFQSLSVRQQMKIGPGLVIASKLLRAPGDELEQLLQQELTDNPALELTYEPGSGRVEPREDVVNLSYGRLSGSSFLGSTARSPSFEEIEEHLAQRRSPVDRLVDQVEMVINESDWELVVTLIHYLDHRGFLVSPPEQLARDLGVSMGAIEQAIQALQQLDPPGIGARNIRECFLIQCIHLEAEGKDCRAARRILTLAWDDFLHQRWPRVARKIGETKQAVSEAVKFMRANLYPYPLAIGEAASASDEILRSADLIIQQENSAFPPVYTIHIPAAERFELRISASLQEACKLATTEDASISMQEMKWIREHVDRARVVIDALAQRWGTLRRIGEYLLRTQHDFIARGPRYLKPVTQASVAKELGLHESTISRAVKDKNVQMPGGRLVPLRTFFDPSLAVKEAIRDLMEGCDTPVHDREIAQQLQSNGIKLARRTVAKYRQEMAI